MARSGPVRNPVVHRPGGLFRDLVESGLDAARQTTDASRAVMQGAVENTVATAYTVIDQYMTRGHSAASLHHRTNGDRPMSDSPFPGAGGGWPPFTRGPADAPPSAFAPQGNPWTAVPPWNTMVEPWLQMMRLWSDGAAMFTGPMGMANPFASMMTPAAQPTVSVRVQSTRATEIALDLSPGTTGSDLTVRRLLSTDGARVATLEGVTVTGQAGHYTVNVAVPDDQEPGSYAGPVENAHQQRVGEVRVIISGAAKGRTAGERSAKTKAKAKAKTKAKTRAKAKVPARTAAKKARTPRPKGPPRAPGKR